jgi:hypothetical protein
VPRNALEGGDLSKAVMEVFNTALDVLAKLGVEVVDLADFQNSTFSDDSFTIMKADIVASIREYLEKLTVNSHNAVTERAL